MFYSVFVLGKKGPLARVWLAAHWDKKITKAQILETNIVESVDSILQPRVKLSLRTSSHLLLGIVRIYARKTLYLLQDCQDAAFKIKSAFRPGAVDLPDGKTEAAISAITLPEMFGFIEDFDLIAEPPVQIDAPAATNANIRSITLQEDMSSINIDDPLINEARDWGEISSVRAASTTDGDEDGATSLRRSKRGDKSKESSHPLDMFDTPLGDDGFAGAAGDGDVDDLFALPVPEEAREQMQREREAREGGEGEGRPISRGSDSYSAPPSAAPSMGMASSPGSVPPQDEEEDHFGPPGDDIFKNGDSGVVPFRKPEGGTLESMVLEPLEGVSQLERGRRKRRKKLGVLIDEIKTLSGEEMKSQLSDTTDIVTNLDLAPPTKMLMHWKRTGGSEKLFALAERCLTSKILQVYYSRNLITSRIESEEEEMEDELVLNGDETDPLGLGRETRSLLPDGEDLQLDQMPPPASPRKAGLRPHKPREGKLEKEKNSPVKKRRRGGDKENQEGSQTPRAKTPRPASERFSDNGHDFDLSDSRQRSIGLPRDHSSLNQSVPRHSTFAIDQNDDEDQYGDAYDQPMSVGPVCILSLVVYSFSGCVYSFSGCVFFLWLCVFSLWLCVFSLVLSFFSLVVSPFQSLLSPTIVTIIKSLTDIFSSDGMSRRKRCWKMKQQSSLRSV